MTVPGPVAVSGGCGRAGGRWVGGRNRDIRAHATVAATYPLRMSEDDEQRVAAAGSRADETPATPGARRDAGESADRGALITRLAAEIAAQDRELLDRLK